MTATPEPALPDLTAEEREMLSEIERLAYAATVNGVFRDYPSLAQEQVRFQVAFRANAMRDRITPHLMIRLLSHLARTEARLREAEGIVRRAAAYATAFQPIGDPHLAEDLRAFLESGR